MPATYKVAVDVLYQVFTIYHPYVALSLDIGAGLGAATKALDDYYITNDLVLYEKEDAMINLAKTLYQDEDIGKRINYRKFDATKDEIEERDYGLVMASYVLNELKAEERKLLIDKMYNATRDLIIIIEPGTPLGYSIIKEVREELISRGMKVIAPCPHEGECPMKNNDWCHFATRLQRSKLHKSLKEGEAPFEDEKYSYIALSKKGKGEAGNRILRHPIIKKGLIKLTVCNANGIEELDIRKKHPDFKVIKKLSAGDKF